MLSLFDRIRMSQAFPLPVKHYPIITFFHHNGNTQIFHFQAYLSQPFFWMQACAGMVREKAVWFFQDYKK